MRKYFLSNKIKLQLRAVKKKKNLEVNQFNYTLQQKLKFMDKKLCIIYMFKLIIH